ncbi:sensor histidine kinase [Nisaea denitrificans]|uniref:sensor histidine kinase n=1 Tax=Nisaea denitrificans TaxID=390877 RepID=UPI00041AC0B1|nr:PAS domain-containing protein [Nisaea denitrificans]
MSTSPTRSSTVKSVSGHQARLVIIVATLLGLTIGIGESVLEYFGLRSDLFETTEKAAQAFEQTASVAVVSRDPELAAQIATGLLHFEAIISVELTDQTGATIISEQRTFPPLEDHWYPELFPPVTHALELELSDPATPGITVGSLRITASSWQISEEWPNRLAVALLAMAAGIAALAAILFYISERFVTRPLLQLAAAYRHLNADDPKQSPLPEPDDFDFLEYREIAASGARLMRDITRNSEVRDLTASELFRSQKRFQDFAEISSDWFWETDRDGGISYISASFTKTLNKRSGEIYGRTLAETSSEDTQTPKWRGLNDVIEQRRQFRDFRYDIESQPGVRKTVSINGRPFYDEAGTFIGYRGTGADVTNERLIAEARNEALQRAEHANRTKSEFLATMSHEFRTPLNAIIGFSSLLAMPNTRDMAVERLADYSGAIQQSGQHMLELVNDILDISAIEAGKRILTLEEVGIGAIFTHCISQVDGQARNKAITISTSVEMASDLMITDERSIRQILLNLLSNAVKFTPDGGAIRCLAEADGSEIVFRIEDSGVGISKDRLPTIAEPFSHSSIHPHVAKEGTGLGLSIVRSLAQFLGGSFMIESEPGAGTSVTVILPRVGQDTSLAQDIDAAD